MLYKYGKVGLHFLCLRKYGLDSNLGYISSPPTSSFRPVDDSFTRKGLFHLQWMCLLVCEHAGAVSVPAKKWEEVKWQANCTDRIRHNRASVVATGFELGCATVPKMYLELHRVMLRFRSKGNKPLHAVLTTTD